MGGAYKKQTGTPQTGRNKAGMPSFLISSDLDPLECHSSLELGIRSGELELLPQLDDGGQELVALRRRLHNALNQRRRQGHFVDKADDRVLRGWGVGGELKVLRREGRLKTRRNRAAKNHNQVHASPIIRSILP